jgi:hypothetical protein
VLLRGSIVARLRGETLPFLFGEAEGGLDGARHFDVTLEPHEEKSGLPRLKAATNPDGAFSLRSVPPGRYRVRVRIPTIETDNDLGVVYSAPLEVRPEPSKQELAIEVPFLALRMTTPDGQPAKGEVLKLKVSRAGGELDQNWPEITFAAGKPGVPQALAEAPRAILVNLSEGGFSFTWVSKEQGVMIFPIVEEDAPIRYRMAVRIPGMGYCLRRFGAQRDGAPQELEFRLKPFGSLSGTVSGEGVQLLQNSGRVSLSLLETDPDADVLGTFLSTTVAAKPDGTFTFTELPEGLVQLTGRGRSGMEGNVACFRREWIELGSGEKRIGVELRLAPLAPNAPNPGQIMLRVVEEVTEKPVAGAELELRIEGEPLPVRRDRSLGPDGTAGFENLRPRAYRVRCSEPKEHPGQVVEVTVTEAELRKGVRKTIPFRTPRSDAQARA